MKIDTELRYYRAAGRSLEAIHEFDHEFEAAQQALQEYRESIHAEAFAGSNGQEPMYARFKAGHEPDRTTGWIPVGEKALRRLPKVGATWYTPSSRSNAGRSLHRKLRSLKLPGGPRFTAIIGAPTGHWAEGNHLYTHCCGFEKRGDVFVVWVHPMPDEPEFHPPDATELKLSEYVALVEANEDPDDAKEVGDG